VGTWWMSSAWPAPLLLLDFLKEAAGLFAAAPEAYAYGAESAMPVGGFLQRLFG
jgi:hypothetical protein